MTLGAKAVPFKESLVPSLRDVSVCPRTAMVLQFGSDATEASPAIVVVPDTPQHFLGIQLSNVTIAFTATAAPSQGGCHDAFTVNVCMQQMDGRGRPYGAVLPLAAFDCAQGVAAHHQSTTVSIPLNRDQRVALFLRHAPLARSGATAVQRLGECPMPACVVTICGHALCQFHRTTQSPVLRQKLSKMVKNAGIPEAALVPASSQNIMQQPAVPSPSRGGVPTTEAVAGPPASRKKRSRDDDGVPSLIPAFVAGGSDES